MKLIADSGATSTNWVAVVGGKAVMSFETSGINPSFMTFEEIITGLAAELPSDLPYEEIEEVWFYGAGVTPALEAPMRGALGRVFSGTLPERVHATSDTLGACRALLGDKPGFAAILGTGMNTCFYDGEKIGFKIAALGFILGDEGSGAYIGRKFVVDYLRGNMPDGVQQVAAREIGLDMAGVIEQVYRKPNPNRWCAKFAKVVSDHITEDSYYWNLVRTAFDDFFWNVVTHYEGYEMMEFNCVGSVADGFRDVLELVAAQYHMKVGKILKTPLEGLVEYHS